MPTGVVDIFMLVDNMKGGRIKCPYSVTTLNPNFNQNKMSQFSQVMQSFPQFVGETQCDFDQALDWVIDQCNFRKLTDEEVNEVEKVFEDNI